MIKQNVSCPICGALVKIKNDIEESEIIVCPECLSRLVVEKIKNGKVSLTQAPEIEEDWGE